MMLLGSAALRAIVITLTYTLPISVGAADPAATYTDHAIQAIKVLNDEFYNKQTGIWDDAWWNSGNALTTLADFASLRRDEANKLNVGGIMANTFVQAQKTNVQTVKKVKPNGMPESVNCIDRHNGCLAKRAFTGKRAKVSKRAEVSRRGSLSKRGFHDFLNEYYDDEGWWALALVRSYDVTQNKTFLDAAVEIFQDMQTGRGTPCGASGGIFWNKQRKYVNAIANELYLSVSASLARRIPSNHTYRSIAEAQWDWFSKSGLINDKSLVNDGLDNCKNNGLQTWSYNQGVILGGLTELRIATYDARYVEAAVPIALAAIKALSNQDGILVETDKCETKAGRCGKDGQQFKGIFIRNLRYLHEQVPLNEFRDFILRNADAIWKHDQRNGKLGVAWAGPYTEATGPTQSSALDALVAAIAVSK